MSDQRERMKSDFSKVGDLLGRAFFGDEPLKDILSGEKSAAAPQSKNAHTAPVEETCPVCGAAEEAPLANRMITRASGEKIPCPGCLGRK
jgi:hypothetical protein